MFEDDDDEDDDETPPRIQVGEETNLEFDDDEEDAKSVDTETELMQKATDETVSLNL